MVCSTMPAIHLDVASKGAMVDSGEVVPGARGSLCSATTTIQNVRYVPRGWAMADNREGLRT